MEMPRITISAQHTVRYSQIKDVPDHVWDRYQAILAEYEGATRATQRELDRELENIAESYIDFRDVLDSDDLEDIEIDLYVETADAQ
jgi:hypothetical protein